MNIVIQPRSNTVKFYEADPTNPVPELAYNSYGQTIQNWQFGLPYLQKLLFTDMVVLQFHVYNESTTPPDLYICDQNKNIIGVIGSLYPNAPYFKGYQDIGTYTDPVTSATYNTRVYMFSFRFGDFTASLNGENTYFIKLDFPAEIGTTPYSYFSEPLQVRYEHPYTNLFQFSYNSNNSEKNLVQNGWFYDYPTNTLPYNPTWAVRVEAYKVYQAVKAVNIGYLQSNYQQLQNKTVQRPFWKLCVGENCLGIPPALLEIVSEALLADNVWYAGNPYILDNPDNKSSLVDLWKIKQTDTKPLYRAELTITERYDSQRAMVSNSIIPLWTTPESGFPYGLRESSIFNGIDILVAITQIPFYSGDDEAALLSNLNSYYLDTYGLTGIFTHEGGVWAYQNGVNETFTLFQPSLILTSYFVVVKQHSAPFTGGFLVNGDGGSLNQGFIDWGDGNIGGFEPTFTGPFPIYNAYATGGTFTCHIFHNEWQAEIDMGQHYGYPENNTSVSGELPINLLKLSIWGNSFGGAGLSPIISIDRCRGLQSLIIRNCAIAGLTNQIFDVSFTALSYIDFRQNQLTAEQVDNLFNTFYHNTVGDGITPSGYFDISGGTNASPTFASALARTRLIDDYSWTIITN